MTYNKFYSEKTLEEFSVDDIEPIDFESSLCINQSLLSLDINKDYNKYQNYVNYVFNFLKESPSITSVYFLTNVPSSNIPELKRGVLDINNEYNDAKYNIELIKEDEEVVEPEQPEGGETPEEPEPENPSEPENPEPEEPKEEEPVAEAKIMYGLMPIADHMESIDAITAEDLAAVEYTKVEVAAMEKTNIPVNENDILVILIPADSALVATRDNGVGTKVAFMEDIIGCNGQKTYTIEGIEYKLYAEFQTVGATGYYFYVD